VNSPVLRYALTGLLALAALVGLTLLVRPLIFSIASPRDDSVYALVPVASVSSTPVVKEVLLNTSHGLLGERPQGAHVAITLLISRPVAGGYSVVDAWSPLNDCALTVATDRLLDCRQHAWTFAGDPIASGDPVLERFAVTSENGALIADLTHPVDAAR
jgi:hypothetical protein